VAYKYLNMAHVRMEQKILLAEESRKSIREMVTLMSQMVQAYVGFLGQRMAPRRRPPTQMVFDLGDLGNLGNLGPLRPRGAPVPPGPGPSQDGPQAGGDGSGAGNGNAVQNNNSDTEDEDHSDLPPLEDDVPINMSRSTILNREEEEVEEVDADVTPVPKSPNLHVP
jgi:hypothetical protein